MMPHKDNQAHGTDSDPQAVGAAGQAGGLSTYILGLMYYKTGQYDKAVEKIEQAVSQCGGLDELEELFAWSVNSFGLDLKPEPVGRTLAMARKRLHESQNPS